MVGNKLGMQISFVLQNFNYGIKVGLVGLEPTTDGFLHPAPKPHHPLVSLPILVLEPVVLPCWTIAPNNYPLKWKEINF